MNRKPADSDALKTRLAKFGARNRDNPAVNALLRELAELAARSMPRNPRRFSRVAALFERLDPKKKNDLFDLAPRELEALVYGKQGRTPVSYSEAAAAFIKRTRNGEPLRVVQVEIVDRLVADRSITRVYAARRLGEELKKLSPKSAKARMFVRRDAE